MKNTIIILFLITLVSCCTFENPFSNTVNEELNSYYKHDLFVNINGQEIVGTGIIPRANEYLMTIESRVDVDMVSITTCNRSFQAFNIINTSWLKPKQTYQYKWWPTEIEKGSPSCRFQVNTFNKSNSSNNASAFIQFEDQTFKLPSHLICNGYEADYNGISICQASTGTLQRIRFANPVKFSPLTKCEIKDLNTLSFDITPKLGSCEVVFMDQSSGKMHKLTVIGYNNFRIKI